MYLIVKICKAKAHEERKLVGLLADTLLIRCRFALIEAINATASI